MQDENPIEAEQRRRQEALEKAEALRYIAIVEAENGDAFRAAFEASGEQPEDEKKIRQEVRRHLEEIALGKKLFAKMSPDEQERAITDEIARMAKIVGEKPLSLSEVLQQMTRKALYEEAPTDDHAPRVGGWKPGNHRPETHEALLFEIEAERALFLGRPAPRDPEPDLRALHQELHQLHSTYQRTGDRSLLLPIADLTARYNALLPKPKPRMDKNRRPPGGNLRDINPN